jgi:thioredoxin reductase
MLVTTLVFLAVTAVFVALHLRRSRAGVAPAAAARCPRCRAALPAGAESCPSCAAPLQAFEIALSPVVSTNPAARDALHAIVRADLCVGCGTCVAACPEPGAIRVADHRAFVDLDRCRGHGDCAAACPVGAIVVSTGDAVQRVEVPQVDVHFQTNVPGLYVVGELGGRGLIKNAINEGKLAVEHIAAALAGAPRRDDELPAYDVVIAGSGPAGLSAGLAAIACGLRYLVLEQGTLADTIARYPRRKVLFSEPLRMPLYGDLWVADASKEALLQIWQDVIRRSGLVVRTGMRVESVERRNGLLLVRAGGREFPARTVVLAIGRRGTPRRLGIPGEDLPKVYYDIVEMEAFAGRRVLVVGGGDSAIESALGLSNQPGTTVTLSHRGADFAKARERNRARLEDAVAAGRVHLLLDSRPVEIRPESVVLAGGAGAREIPNDEVFVRIGGDAPYPFLERCGVRIVHRELRSAAPMPEAVA